jgi:hypothetical protein
MTRARGADGWWSIFHPQGGRKIGPNLDQNILRIKHFHHELFRLN